MTPTTERIHAAHHAENTDGYMDTCSPPCYNWIACKLTRIHAAHELLLDTIHAAHELLLDAIHAAHELLLDAIHAAHELLLDTIHWISVPCEESSRQMNEFRKIQNTKCSREYNSSMNSRVHHNEAY